MPPLATGGPQREGRPILIAHASSVLHATLYDSCLPPGAEGSDLKPSEYMVSLMKDTKSLHNVLVKVCAVSKTDSAKDKLPVDLTADKQCRQTKQNPKFGRLPCPYSGAARYRCNATRLYFERLRRPDHAHPPVHH